MILSVHLPGMIMWKPRHQAIDKVREKFKRKNKYARFALRNSLACAAGVIAKQRTLLIP